MAKLSIPFFAVSFKSYLEAVGERALKLAKIMEKVSLDSGVCMVVLPQFCDIEKIAREVEIPVFAQHVDPVEPGAFTGHVLPEAVKEAGAIGTMLNHKERRLKLVDLTASIKRCREVGLISMVCAANSLEAGAIAKLKPDMILAEPPELIGTGKAVSKYDQNFIIESTKAIKEVDPTIIHVTGAGISTASDVLDALKLGAEGVGAASGIVKAKDPYKILKEIADTINEWKSLKAKNE